MLHPTMQDFLKSLEAAGRLGTVASYDLGLRQFSTWLASQNLDALRVTTDNLHAYQRWLAESYRQSDGQPLKKSTQQTRLIPVLAYYRWLLRRGILLHNPARKVKLPRLVKRATKKDYLDLQEATALVQTQSQKIEACEKGSFKWAEECRNLAMVCLALATGRRRQSLLDFRVTDLDLQRHELRVEWEKGKAGRVLPVASWAIGACRTFLNGPRARLLEGRADKGWLFPGSMNDKVARPTFRRIIVMLHARAARENPDLEGFVQKRISPHCLRVSFATLLFKGGCNIRSVNELMLHSSLSTTARYTPIPFEDLRRVCRMAHPRA